MSGATPPGTSSVIGSGAAPGVADTSRGREPAPSAEPRRPLLLGEAPNRPDSLGEVFPLSGVVAERLCKLAGIPPLEGESRYGQWTWALYEAFQCRNLYERHGEAYPWSKPAAADRASQIADQFPPVVVLLGRRVAAAFDFEDLAWGEWARTAQGSGVVLPHPSGRNLLYRDEEFRALAGRVLNEAIERARG